MECYNPVFPNEDERSLYMSKQELNVKGQTCPLPLIATKKALTDPEYDETFTVHLDNETSKNNVERYLADNKISFNSSAKGDEFILEVTKGSAAAEASSVEGYCVPGVQTGHVVCIKSSKMGEGADELGTILIQAFVNTLKEASPLPESIIFYNSGVNLVIDSSPVFASLKELEGLGVNLVICGTCADYFDIKGKISIGTISNMYTIIETLTKASKVIYP
jgi:selenium metabolism protein YedF